MADTPCSFSTPVFSSSQKSLLSSALLSSALILGGISAFASTAEAATPARLPTINNADRAKKAISFTEALSKISAEIKKGHALKKPILLAIGENHNNSSHLNAEIYLMRLAKNFHFNTCFLESWDSQIEIRTKNFLMRDFHQSSDFYDPLANILFSNLIGVDDPIETDRSSDETILIRERTMLHQMMKYNKDAIGIFGRSHLAMLSDPKIQAKYHVIPVFLDDMTVGSTANLYALKFPETIRVQTTGDLLTMSPLDITRRVFPSHYKQKIEPILRKTTADRLQRRSAYVKIKKNPRINPVVHQIITSQRWQALENANLLEPENILLYEADLHNQLHVYLNRNKWEEFSHLIAKLDICSHEIPGQDLLSKPYFNHALFDAFPRESKRSVFRSITDKSGYYTLLYFGLIRDPALWNGPQQERSCCGKTR